MIEYKEYEKQVHNWLQEKHKKDNTFTFSVRMKGSKGAETDYFVGTKKSNYFATTFWTIPVSFPGSSGDAISLIFGSKGDYFGYNFEFTQTKTPPDTQNKLALELINSIKSSGLKNIEFSYVSPEQNKMLTFKTESRQKNYTSLNSMLDDVEKDLEIIMPIVDNKISDIKKKNPEFVAHRITFPEYNKMQSKLEKRFSKYQVIENGGRQSQVIREQFSEWLKGSETSNKINSYLRAIDILSEILEKDIYLEKNIKNLNLLYQDLIDKQRIKDGKYYYSKAPSYGDSGFYSASIKAFIEFLEVKDSTVPIHNKEMSTPKNLSSLNQIFYGPPGTGKTYNTILEAAKIIEDTEEMEYEDALEVFNKELESRIEFITFHQNYSYEDFIQGLRPDVEQKNLSFNRSDGLFTKIAVNALFEFYKVFQKKQRAELHNPKPIDINEAYLEFLNYLELDQEFETRTKEKVKVTAFTDRQNIEFKHVKGTRPYLVSGTRLIKLYKAFPSIENIQRVNEDIREAIGGCNTSIYYVALREFIDFLSVYEVNKDILDESVEEPFNYDDITYSRKKELLMNTDLRDLRTVEPSEVPNYVIIIDEINRANISRVFGELITLIEKDKRSHGKIPLTVTLPSGEKFVVPSNLYIVGTMNTADKSIALLDIALRRRFEFVSMYPKYKLDDEIINHHELLEKINTEIINRKGYDFTIGHSYFMGSEFSLANTINNKVLPLLLEYFMNDHEEVRKILNNCGIILGNEWPLKYESTTAD